MITDLSNADFRHFHLNIVAAGWTHSEYAWARDLGKKQPKIQGKRHKLILGHSNGLNIAGHV